ncbi:antA/AntB antirepressor family protein [Sphingobacterium sp.]|uniref:antA/AntB antirepressor family protein n=1 Tax=Sphingobacterium sp. TaxID=341027 RepID=UPI0028A0C21A|nr:antA/AntB antirepressor family protein [Sphingobacterium sp.]
MEELIPLNKENPNSPVSARDLYEFLEIKTEFSKWCTRMFGYGFTEGEDYSLVKIGERSAHNKIDYALTLDCAKEISMIQRSEKGKIARQYFLDCEKIAKKAVNQNPAELSRMDILKLAMEAEKENQQLKQIVEVQEKKLERKSALEAFAEHLTDEEVYTITSTAIAGRLGFRSANELNSLLVDLGVIKKLYPDYNMTAKYSGMKYGKRVVVHEVGQNKYEALRWSSLGEAFIVNKIQGLDRTRYKTQIIPLTSTISVIN